MHGEEHARAAMSVFRRGGILVTPRCLAAPASGNSNEGAEEQASVERVET